MASPCRDVHGDYLGSDINHLLDNLEELQRFLASYGVSLNSFFRLRLDVGIGSLGVELCQITNQSSFGIELQ